MPKDGYIHLADRDRWFEAPFHLLAYEEEVVDHKTTANRIIMASYMGIPESVRAISAGVLEGRTLRVNGGMIELSRARSATYRRVEKRIGLGDVAHGMVFHSFVTLDGVENAVQQKKEEEEETDDTKSYIVAPDGDISRAVGEHLVARFGLPREWQSQYYTMLLEGNEIHPIEVLRNPDYQEIWPNFTMVRLDASEERILEMVSDRLRSRRICIPPTDVEGIFSRDMSMNEYLKANSHHFAKRLSEKKPRHSPDEPLDKSIGMMKRVPFPAQAHVIQGLANTLQYESSVICSGDMGTGSAARLAITG